MVLPSLLPYIIASTFVIRSSNAQSATSTSSTPKPTILTQHIFHPAHKDLLVPGSLSTIRWTANPSFKNVTIQLWDNTSWGYSHDLLTPCIPWGRNPFCGTIATHVPNTGAFDWYTPNPANGSLGFGFPRDEQVFWVKIFVEDFLNQEIGNSRPVVSWSQNFAFAADGEGGSTVEEEPSASNWDGVPVYVTDGPSVTSTPIALNTAATTTSATTTTATNTTTSAVPKDGYIAPAPKSEATTLKRNAWLLGALSLVLGHI